ncbi:acetyl-CoA carboxylase, carboxyltransferase subunit beta [Tichowtungia aerotolerans]|uniref:Acetyl-coenzyme A carboxylase carboxyl transferase subunit beta n=1 Tax=Tichowtungia aerotolerans TaxID=2697043 RepID=A0A6P1MCA2_9BACT|nr:acetyl-CoA carboxylase, carboxyltransferase subunit beta [Tichowtungia aerotolerans]QHI70733.1 acetyl-CoA carboxylase carboxyltransferase subunit beta [Tichowtungia aerotolerans]
MALRFGKKKYSTVQVRKRDVPDGLWEKCPGCSEIIYTKELAENLQVCPKCGYHFSLGRQARIDLFADEGTFQEWDANMTSADPLGFTGQDSYIAKLEANQKKTGFKDAVTCGAAKINGRSVGISVMDFKFLGASMGSVVGEKITRQIERCTEQKIPCIIVCASGGARMYEGLFSLMQMAKTSAALARHAEAGLPYIPVLTHPTMAGVMASFATLGDIIMAEPGALIGFAGPRVIKETTQQDLPEGFQRAEFLEKHGLIDMVVPRHELKERLSTVLDYMMDT